MSEVGALAGLIAAVALITCAVLVYHAVLLQSQVNRLQKVVRNLGVRIRVPASELPPPPIDADEYAPDAVVDEESVEREWRLPTGLRGGWDL